MAVTDTTSLTFSIYASILARDVIPELRPAMFMRRYLRTGDLQGQSATFDFRLIDSNTTNSPLVLYSNTETGVGTDGTTAYTTRKLSTTRAQATAAVVGTSALIGDFTAAITVEDAKAEIAAVLSRTLAHKWEFDAAANLANFSNTTTAASAQLSAEDLMAAIAGLEQRDVTAGYVGGFHPKQLADVRANIAGLTGEVWGKDGAPDLMGHYRDNWGTFYGITLNATTVVGSSAGNYQGAVFAANEALGYVELWGAKLETWRDKTLATYVIGSMAYGSVEIDDLRGQTVLSSTT